MEMEAWLLLVSRRGKRVPELGVDGIWGDVGGHVVPVAGGRWAGAGRVDSGRQGTAAGCAASATGSARGESGFLAVCSARVGSDGRVTRRRSRPWDTGSSAGSGVERFPTVYGELCTNN